MPDPRIQFIIDNLQEGLEVEAKNWLGGLSDNNQKAKLAKEIIALGNQGGGHIFIGFNDAAANLEEIAPEAGQLEAFTQDSVSSLVQRYVTPACQCRVEFASPTGSTVTHPVIVVPGNHRTPLFASRGSEDGGLQSGKVYVRRPGGYSEEARTQDDWEKLIDRLVRARQSEMLDAMREVMNPSATVLAEAGTQLEEWRAQSHEAWQRIVDEFAPDDPRRLPQGYWTIAFRIEPFSTESLAELNTVLDRDMPKYSGWPPFTYLHREPVQPRAHGDLIVAYIGNAAEGEDPNQRADYADYWRLSRDGNGFLLRPMQEDREGYPGQIHPPPQGPFFDWVFPIYRTAEVLKFIEALAAHFSNDQAVFELQLNYHGTSGRHLESAMRNYLLDDGARCDVNELQNTISATIADIGTNLEELLYTLLRSIYEQFEFTELPRALVNNVVQEVIGNRRQ